jgi:predicted transcriptional regulator
MDSTLKYQLIEKIVQTNDESLLQEIKVLLESASGDWWEKTSQAERESIERGIQQADRGEVIPHEQAWSQLLASRKNRV